ncbi:MAG: hypothetical protein GY820_46795 [Gammaproteobacteria bacterium]|nr:hypothetical protein [Gammaproteobacteria bacterium]
MFDQQHASLKCHPVSFVDRKSRENCRCASEGTGKQMQKLSKSMRETSKTRLLSELRTMEIADTEFSTLHEFRGPFLYGKEDR